MKTTHGKKMVPPPQGPKGNHQYNTPHGQGEGAGRKLMEMTVVSARHMHKTQVATLICLQGGVGAPSLDHKTRVFKVLI